MTNNRSSRRVIVRRTNTVACAIQIMSIRHFVFIFYVLYMRIGVRKSVRLVNFINQLKCSNVTWSLDEPLLDSSFWRRRSKRSDYERFYISPLKIYWFYTKPNKNNGNVKYIYHNKIVFCGLLFDTYSFFFFSNDTYDVGVVKMKKKRKITVWMRIILQPQSKKPTHMKITNNFFHLTLAMTCIW